MHGFASISESADFSGIQIIFHTCKQVRCPYIGLPMAYFAVIRIKKCVLLKIFCREPDSKSVGMLASNNASERSDVEAE